MFHFQTQKYSAHKAADNYLEKYTANLDRFMEVWQGQHGRLSETNINIFFDTVDDVSIDKHLALMVDYFLSLSCLTPDLASIRDDMLADLQQFQYLLTFN